MFFCARPIGPSVFLIFYFAVAGCGSSSEEAVKIAATTDARNARWATPLKKPGLPNLHQVSPGIYRGAQPLPEGFKELKSMGIKTIINFRNYHSDLDEIRAAGLEGAFRYYDMGMNTWDMTDARAAAFLTVIEDEKNLPLFYHCQHGADRTGTMSAIYRIAHQNWSKDEALDEMQNGGYGYHEVWTNLIKFLSAFEPDRVRTLMTTAPKPSPVDAGN